MTTRGRLPQRLVVYRVGGCSATVHGAPCPAASLSTFDSLSLAIPSSDWHSAAGRAARSGRTERPTPRSHAACPASHARTAEWRRSCERWAAVGVAATSDCGRDVPLSADPESLTTAPGVAPSTPPINRYVDHIPPAHH